MTESARPSEGSTSQVSAAWNAPCPAGRKVNIYLPVDLFDEAKGLNLNLSRILRDALEGVLRSPEHREHYSRRNYIPGPGGGRTDEYQSRVICRDG